MMDTVSSQGHTEPENNFFFLETLEGGCPGPSPPYGFLPFSSCLTEEIKTRSPWPHLEIMRIKKTCCERVQEESILLIIKYFIKANHV